LYTEYFHNFLTYLKIIFLESWRCYCLWWYNEKNARKYQ